MPPLAGSFLIALPSFTSRNVDPLLVNTGIVKAQSGTVRLIGGLLNNGAGSLTDNAGASLEIARFSTPPCAAVQPRGSRGSIS